MNVPEISHKIRLLYFLSRFRLVGKRDGWTLSIKESRSRESCVLYMICRYGIQATFVSNTDDLAFLRKEVFPALGVEPEAHQRVMSKLERRVGPTRKTEIRS